VNCQQIIGLKDQNTHTCSRKSNQKFQPINLANELGSEDMKVKARYDGQIKCQTKSISTRGSLNWSPFIAKTMPHFP